MPEPELAYGMLSAAADNPADRAALRVTVRPPRTESKDLSAEGSGIGQSLLDIFNWWARKKMFSAQADVGALTGMAELPTKAREAAAGLQETGEYSPEAPLNMALMTMGGGAFHGAPKGAVGSAGGRPGVALPMDEASRTARMTEQGFTRDAYRGEGSALEGEQYRTGHPTRYDPGFLGGDAIYAMNTPRIASSYANLKALKAHPEVEAPNVVPLKVKLENPLVITGEQKMEVAALDQAGRDAWLRDVRARGHDGVVVDYGGGEQEFVLPNPEKQMKSRFARFDPEDPGTLLGSGATSRKLAAPILATAGERSAGPNVRRYDIKEASKYLTDPVAERYPGIYQDPRELAAAAEAKVAPEHPALKELFGVTRQDLYDISQGGTRAGNVDPMSLIKAPAKPGGSYMAENIMTPQNAQRLIDTLAEARKGAPGLTQGMIPWYVMDPAYQRLEQLVGPAEAQRLYTRGNTLGAMASPASDVELEINRGTAANMMAERGQFGKFKRYGGIAEEERGRGFPQALRDVKAHPYHSTAHTGPMERYLESGNVDMGSVKVPLYIGASGVPQTGFQTRLPVPDAHFTRAVGMADVRTGAKPGVSMKTPEYLQSGPWFREQVAAPSGFEAVPAQALTWGLYGPQTGVDTLIGAPKLELLSKAIYERAQRLGIDPHMLRDMVLTGQQHAELTPEWLTG